MQATSVEYKEEQKRDLRNESHVFVYLGVINKEAQYNAYIDPNITVNVIKDGVIVGKHHLELPEKLVNVIQCKNPRCITSIEPEIEHVFKLADKEKGIYRCAYCEAEKN